MAALWGMSRGKIKQRGWILLSDMVRGRRAQWPNGRDWGEGEAEGRTLSQPGTSPTEAGGGTHRCPKGPWAWVKGHKMCPLIQTGSWHPNRHQVLGLGLGKGWSFPPPLLGLTCRKGWSFLRPLPVSPAGRKRQALSSP